MAHIYTSISHCTPQIHYLSDAREGKVLAVQPEDPGFDAQHPWEHVGMVG